MRMGDTVVILGSGPVGLNAAILAQLRGAQQVILIGGPARRLSVGQLLGADETMNIDEVEFSERLARVRELTNSRGADIVIEATGVPEAVTQGLELARDAGTVVIAGQYTDAGDITINPHELLNKKHLDIRGCWGVDFSHFYRGIQLMSKHHEDYPWEELISQRYLLSEAEEALRAVESWSVTKALIVP
jgi:L-iditol 2-dehydrogenase